MGKWYISLSMQDKIILDPPLILDDLETMVRLIANNVCGSKNVK